jgi:hypothetical protein
MAIEIVDLPIDSMVIFQFAMWLFTRGYLVRTHHRPSWEELWSGTSGFGNDNRKHFTWLSKHLRHHHFTALHHFFHHLYDRMYHSSILTVIFVLDHYCVVMIIPTFFQHMFTRFTWYVSHASASWSYDPLIQLCSGSTFVRYDTFTEIV